MEKYYYHITDPKNVKNIIKEGLIANEDGDIFLFENKSIGTPIGEGKMKIICVADHIARNQVFLEKYAMFEISADGIEGDLIKDNVCEITAELQWIVKQQRIAPEYIKPFGLFKAAKPKFKKI